MVIELYKVPAEKTSKFKEWQHSIGHRQDSPATILNLFSGYNYWYVSELVDNYFGFGDITEERAEQYSKEYGITIKEF